MDASNLINSSPGHLLGKPGRKGALYKSHTGQSQILKYVDERLVNSYGEKTAMSENYKKEADILSKKYYGDDLDEISGGNKNVNIILGRTLVASFDEGTKNEHSFTLSEKKYTESGHAILSRKAMLTILKDRAGLHFDVDKQEYVNDKKFKILTLDLANFREADLQGAADYDLNIFTRQLNLAIDTIAKKYQVDPRDLIACRYGGDEFYVAVVENTREGKVNLLDKTEEVKKTIAETVSSTMGFFGENVETNFKLKNDQIEEINIEEFEKDRIKKTIFLDSLTKDLVLGKDELENEHVLAIGAVTNLENLETDQTARQEFIKYLGHRKNSIYPDLIRNTPDKRLQINKKIQFLIAGHDELRLPYILAEDEDARESVGKDTPVTKRTEKLLHFYENFLIDPLLNEIVMSRADFYNNIKRGEFSKIYAYEIKAKEINDNLSFVYCDNTIKALWEQRLKDGLRQAIKEGRVKIGRIGGLLVVGMTGKGELDETTVNILKNQAPLTTKFGKKEIPHEIGYAEIAVPTEITDIDSKKKDEAFKATMEALINKPTYNWLQKTFKRIINSQTEFEEFIESIKDKEFKSSNLLTMISARYFDSPKRAKNRLVTALEVIGELRYKGLDSNRIAIIEQILIKMMELNKKISLEK